MKNVSLINIIALVLVFSVSGTLMNVKCQIRENGTMNIINTAVPSIRLSPDARATALGGIGIASSPDISSQHWNHAKYVFMENSSGVSTSFAPWMGKVPGKYLGYLAGYYTFNESQSISGSLKYNSLGETVLTDNDGNVLNTILPYELFIDVGYAKKFTDNLSGGVLFKYIYSNQTVNQLFGTIQTSSGQAVSADISLFYNKKLASLGEFSQLNIGVNLSNIGTPVTYTEDLNKREPLPTNLGFGSSIELGKDESNSFTLFMEINKLLVPSNPIMDGDSLIRGKVYPSTVVKGMFVSFIDAPGIAYSDGTYSSVFREEMAEISLSFGAEYKLQDQIYFRTGYHYESEVKGNRNYLSFGVGINKPVIVNIAYVMSLNILGSPLANTLHISLGYNFSSNYKLKPKRF